MCWNDMDTPREADVARILKDLATESVARILEFRMREHVQGIQSVDADLGDAFRAAMFSPRADQDLGGRRSGYRTG